MSWPLQPLLELRTRRGGDGARRPGARRGGPCAAAGREAEAARRARPRGRGAGARAGGRAPARRRWPGRTGGAAAGEARLPRPALRRELARRRGLLEEAGRAGSASLARPRRGAGGPG